MGIPSINALYHSIFVYGQTLETPIPSLWQKISSAYKSAVKQLIEFLRSHKYITTAGVMGTLLFEPLINLQAAYLFPYGWKEKFQYYGLNPEKLTPSQAQKRPLLCIHGDNHNQSAWLTLAKASEQSHAGPIFTINLDLKRSSWTEDARSLLNAKIEEIKRQYREQGIDDVQIDIAGHSTGASLAFYTALEPSSWKVSPEGRAEVNPDKIAWRKDIGNIIRIGTPTTAKENELLDPEMRNRIFEIDGTDDLLVDARSTARPDHRAEIPCGHVELIFSPETCALISRWRGQAPVRV